MIVEIQEAEGGNIGDVVRGCDVGSSVDDEVECSDDGGDDDDVALRHMTVTNTQRNALITFTLAVTTPSLALSPTHTHPRHFICSLIPPSPLTNTPTLVLTSIPY